MEGNFFLGLVDNAALLLALVLIFQLFTSKFKKIKSFLWKVIVGIFLGVICLAVMQTNWTLIPGVIFDTRSVLLGITGLFIGWIPTLIAMTMATVYRIYLGGGGVYMGVSVIFSSGLIGLIWRSFRQRDLHRISFAELYIFGLSIHVVMLMLTSLLPVESRDEVLSQIWFPVMTIYPVATVLFGKMLSNCLRRELAEIELIESEEKFSQVFKNGPQIITISSLDKGIFLDVNKAFSETLGYSREEAVGKLVESLNIWVDKKDRGDLLEDLKTKEVVSNREYKFRKKNGEIITCLGSATKMKVKGEKCLLLLGNNIEDRKLAEIALEDSKTKLRATLESIVDGVLAMDNKEKILFVNSRFAKMWKIPESLIKRGDGRKLLDYVANQLRKPEEFYNRTNYLFTSGDSGEDTLSFADGKFFERHSIPLVTNGQMVGRVWSFRDVTRERAVDKMRTDFISLASHQMRTPLTGIKWFVELLKGKVTKTSGKSMERYVNNIDESNQRLIDLIDDLLLVSKSDEGLLSAKDLENHSIKKLCQEAIKLQGRLFIEKDIQVEGVDQIPEKYMFEVDKIQMVQVFGNLLNNAGRYSPAGSKIDVRVEKKSRNYIFSVKDTGLGIPENQKSRVFEKFFRADNVSKNIAGSGLGLYLTKSIVEGHGGKVWFESEEGKGTTFFVELPIKKQKKDG